MQQQITTQNTILNKFNDSFKALTNASEVSAKLNEKQLEDVLQQEKQPDPKTIVYLNSVVIRMITLLIGMMTY